MAAFRDFPPIRGAVLLSMGLWSCSAWLAHAATPDLAVSAAIATPLTAAERLVADQVLLGHMPCELGQTVQLRPDPQVPGHFELALKNQRFYLKPVVSATGAVRLEDPLQGVVWLQLRNKSMLMDQKRGRRLADECMGASQRAYTEQTKREPATHLLDVAQKPR